MLDSLNIESETARYSYMNNNYFNELSYAKKGSKHDQVTDCEEFNDKNIRALSVLTHWRRSGVFIFNFEHTSHLVLVFLVAISE